MSPMTARKAEPSRAVAPEWRGFPGRLRYAIDQRQAEDPGLTQNKVAEEAEVDSGNLSKMLSGEKAVGVTANTVIMLARALRVRPSWLLLGEEPSGLGTTPIPQSETRPSSRPR
jgi:hypothetical protein